MQIDERIFSYFQGEAERSTIAEIHIGLGYTVVILEDGRSGLCYTPKEGNGCSVNKNREEFEGFSGAKLLSHIQQKPQLERALAIALVNALSQKQAVLLDEDDGNIVRDLQLKSGDQIAMIGYFEPVIKDLKAQGIAVTAYDIGKQIGSEEAFYDWMEQKGNALILSATSLINSSFESVLSHLEKHRIPTLVMGPSTIMVKEIYQGLPVDFLAGSAIKDQMQIIKAIRNGRGTPYLHPACKKVRLAIN